MQTMTKIFFNFEPKNPCISCIIVKMSNPDFFFLSQTRSFLCNSAVSQIFMLDPILCVHCMPIGTLKSCFLLFPCV